MQRAVSLLNNTFLDDTYEGKHNLPHSTRGFHRRVGFEDPEEVARCSTACIAPSQREPLSLSSDEEANHEECQRECTKISL